MFENEIKKKSGFRLNSAQQVTGNAARSVKSQIFTTLRCCTVRIIIVATSSGKMGGVGPGTDEML